ncbi:28006_t:CDS:2 [Dentiscutata erythropus]|uniref:28006_t:CDS:1 n=1 Tax=Dentiscutata erythropus TaxID=1348616 RepID=A0A9N9A7P5_9GLOM|nr:28006_t:CDS:2 [Dentiscutata erythropus]
MAKKELFIRQEQKEYFDTNSDDEKASKSSKKVYKRSEKNKRDRKDKRDTCGTVYINLSKFPNELKIEKPLFLD